MEPSSDKEREIARIVDARAKQDNLPVAAIGEIAASVPFSMSSAEIDFLIQYISWRRDHPFEAETSG